MTKINFQSLLVNTKTILRHQKEVKRLKGEHFNVFSVLKMETKENSTHSVLLKEILDPNGSHLFGEKFLELFLQTINYNGELDVKSTKVFVEYYIGVKNVNDKSGGRIDIYLSDGQNSISIENKIWAGDQELQIQRYVNHKKDKNAVYYLTLNGVDPSEYSRGALGIGEGYTTISYKSEIVDWLLLCMKEAYEVPMLRESIKQYIILLKKLTNTMNVDIMKDLFDLMLLNYEEADFISTNFNTLKDDIKESFRLQVIEELKNLNLSELNIEVGNKISNLYAQIWINTKVPNVSYGIESFSGNPRSFSAGNLFVGVFVKHQTNINNTYAKNIYWNNRIDLLNENEKINLSDSEILRKLYNDLSFKENLSKQIAQQVFKFIQDNPIY